MNQTLFVVHCGVIQNKLRSSPLNRFKTFNISQLMRMPKWGTVLKMGTYEQQVEQTLG